MIDFVKNKSDFKIETGFYDNIDFADYLRINALSKSAFGHSNNNLDFLKYRDGEFKPSPSMQYGSLVDCLLLEPELFEKNYTIIEGNLNTKKNKELKEQAGSENKNIVKIEDYESAQRVVVCINKSGVAKYLLNTSKKQISFLIEGYHLSPSFENINIKGRYDILSSDVIGDLKTCADPSPEGFGKAFVNFGYYVQAGVYTEAYKTITGDELPFIFLCVSNDKSKYPDVHIYEIEYHDDELIRGREEFRLACERISMFSDDINEYYASIDIEEIKIPKRF